ncbi:MAG TPA: shikimate dehydrogenase [Polyangiaceae bacterium]|nr:shikimate dehydrogenase [Polyangiaceae bacterium]
MTALRFALVGDPVAHSRSPAMHEAAYRALGLPHSYETWRVRDEAELAAAVAKLRSGEVAGLNVTVPHKRAVLALVDELDSVARIVGACNTLVARDGKVVAYDTDVAAIADELRALAPSGEKGGTALVLGSGGAARAAVVACALHLGADHVVVGARKDASAMCAELEASLRGVGCTVHISAVPFPSPSSPPSPRWIIQATSAGMTGAEPGEAVAAAVRWEELAPGAVALDVVYSPPETPFVHAARAAAIPVENGLGMLARQGAAAFELWLGLPAPLEVMRRALA